MSRSALPRLSPAPHAYAPVHAPHSRVLEWCQHMARVSRRASAAAPRRRWGRWRRHRVGTHLGQLLPPHDSHSCAIGAHAKAFGTACCATRCAARGSLSGAGGSLGGGERRSDARGGGLRARLLVHRLDTSHYLALRCQFAFLRSRRLVLLPMLPAEIALSAEGGLYCVRGLVPLQQVSHVLQVPQPVQAHGALAPRTQIARQPPVLPTTPVRLQRGSGCAPHELLLKLGGGALL
mmetsp:Transcript_12574/g.32185  ORF Transcript_12574/g.32185 Transcript_12574/m.32185 type:complete len:235 (+) Transcript_12574:326-1030(+)